MEENQEIEAKEGKSDSKLAIIVSGGLLVLMIAAILLVSMWSDIFPESSSEEPVSTPPPTPEVILPTATPTSQMPSVDVWIDVLDEVRERKRFIVVVSIGNVTALDIAEFEIEFNTDVIEARGADDGEIDGSRVPVSFEIDNEEGTITVISEARGDNGISGSGYLAEIEFKVVGESGDIGTMDIEEGSSRLLDTEGKAIPTDWESESVSVL